MNAMTIMALAMNPNVTSEFFAEMMEKSAAQQAAMMERTLKACEEYPGNIAEILNISLPYILNC